MKRTGQYLTSEQLDMLLDLITQRDEDTGAPMCHMMALEAGLPNTTRYGVEISSGEILDLEEKPYSRKHSKNREKLS